MPPRSWNLRIAAGTIGLRVCAIDVGIGSVTLRIWLQEGHDGEPGVEALGLDFIGFSTWAESEAEVLAKIPSRFAEYARWRLRHELPIDARDARVEVVGRVDGNEILLPPDLESARLEDIDLTIELLRASRGDLVEVLEAAADAVFDWDPPYARFAPWADWRTIRANLAHVANAETHYYARNIGYEPFGAPADPRGDWRDFLPRSRDETVAFLERLKASTYLCRVRTVDHGYGEESWSVKKALRRLVSHELVHSKSIARIIRDFSERRRAEA